MNKNKNIMLPHFIIFILVTACTGYSPNTSSVPSNNLEKIRIPDWYFNPPRESDYIYATGTASSRELQLAIDKATNAAKVDISMSMEVKIEARIQSILVDRVINDEIKSRSMIKESIKSSTETMLHRVTVEDKMVIEDGDLFRAYVLLKMPVISKRSLLNLVSSHFLKEDQFQDSFTEIPNSNNLELDSQWFNGKGVVTLANITPEEAYKMALDLARTDALSQAGEEIIGLTARLIQEGTNTDVYDQFIQFTQSITRGRILEEIIIKNGIELHKISSTGVTRSDYVVEINAWVSPEFGRSDPDFNIELDLNKSVYSNGESLYIELTASKDCYVTIFNLYSNDSLQVVYPNYMSNDNRLFSGSTRIIPSEDDGWELTVRLASELSLDQESLFVVGTKVKDPFSRASNDTDNGLISTGEALIAINKWLINIEKNNRTQAMVTYTIVR